MIFRIKPTDRAILVNALKNFKSGDYLPALKVGFLTIHDEEELQDIRKQLKRYAAVKYTTGKKGEYSEIMHAVGRLQGMKRVRLARHTGEGER